MTDAGAAPPPPSATVACPFVAFEDDRDARSDVPDRRHRCYAEVRPAPRALAHQERYCLAAGFTGCPTFLDWAGREAARVRASAAEPRVPSATDAAYAPGPEATELDADEPEVWPRRPGGRTWAAPPPWAAGAAAAPGAFAAEGTEPPIVDHGVDEPVEPEPGRAGLETVEAPSFIADRPADHAVGAEPGPSSWEELAAQEEPPMRRFGPAAGRSSGRAAPPPPRRRPPADPDAPAWERPRRFEAYPTLRTRAGLPGLSPIVTALGVVIVVALALFFLPPMLLGLGGGSTATPTPPASVAASPTAAASSTPVPSPTPQTYTVKSGDTMSSIARKFGVSLDDLIAANTETVKDPNKLQVGDVLVIPTAPPSQITAAPSPSPSPSS